MFTSVRVFVYSVVNEAKLLSFEIILKCIKKVFGIVIYRLVFSHLMTIDSLPNCIVILTELGKNQQSVFEELRAEYLAEKFYSRF
jgi:hypothetical protein